MPAPAAALALEFEVLMARAARQGRLPLHELLDTYTALVAAGQPELANPRQVDLAAMVRALLALPRGLLAAPSLLLVPNITAYTYTPLEATTYFRCGRLADGSLLGEVPGGLLTLFDWATNLCTLAHEMHKARALVESLPKPPTDPAQLAFAIGHDEATLARALTQTHGELQEFLGSAPRLPEVRVHASLEPQQAERQAERHAQRVLEALAEMGFVDRPLHIWLGDLVLTDVLSPYCRELRPVLLNWARSKPRLLGPDLQALPPEPTDDWLYAIAADFMQADGRLLAERQNADRSVGIYHYRWRGATHGGFELTDLGRIDTRLCDPRLPTWRLRAPAPALLRLSNTCPLVQKEVLRALVHAVGARIGSITVVNEGMTLGGESGSVILPRLMVRWGGGSLQPLPSEGLAHGDFIGLTDRPVQHGIVLSAPSLLLGHAALQAPPANAMASLQPTCVEVGSSALLDVLQEAVWSGKLNEQAEIGWVVIDSEQSPSGRPTVGCLRALSATAVARLRRIVAAPIAPHPQPPGAISSATPGLPGALGDITPRRSTAWGVRLKA